MNYSIDTVARLTEISPFTLRNWEKRYDFLKPHRLENGFRAYGDSHVELLRKVSLLLKHGARIGDLAENIRKGKSLPDVKTAELAPEVQDHAHQLYQALMKYDIRQAEAAHAEIAARFSNSQMLDLLYQPLLSRMGKDWSNGKTSAAQEHFASAFIRLRLMPYLTMFNGSTVQSNPEKKAVCATTAGESHEGGLMLITAHLRMRGWSTYYFGANLPTNEIALAVRDIQPSVVCLSFTDTHALKSAIPHLKQVNSRVCIGGFGALTYDSEDTLPSNIRLIKSGGRDAANDIETLSEITNSVEAVSR